MRPRESARDRAARTLRVRGTRAPRARAAIVGAVSLALLTVCHAQDRSMNDLAERYVRLVLAVGQHDADYVDAYYGPPDWRAAEEQRKRSLAEVSADASGALASLVALAPPPNAEELPRLRHEYLMRQLQALRSRVAMLAGVRLDFDAESEALYDAVAPTHTEAEFAEILAQLERRLPGRGPLLERYQTFRAR